MNDENISRSEVKKIFGFSYPTVKQSKRTVQLTVRFDNLNNSLLSRKTGLIVNLLLKLT